jgi:hypothetical protein
VLWAQSLPERKLRWDGLRSWKLLGELRALRSKRYEDWSLEPFAGLEDTVELGFHTLGLVPDYDGSGPRLRVV